MKIPNNINYTKDHEWVMVDNGVATIGITDFAQSELGDIVFIDVDTIDEILEKDEVFGSIEAVKTVSDLLLPFAGEIIEFNTDLEDFPEKINTDPYGEGWIVKVKLTNTDDLTDLLDATAYKELVGS